MDKEQFKQDVNRLIDASESFYSLDPLLTKYTKMLWYRIELIEFLENNEKKKVENTFRDQATESKFKGFGGAHDGFGGGGASGEW